MLNVKRMLALAMMVVLLASAGIMAFAEEDVTVKVPETVVEQPKETKAEQPKAEEPKVEEPKVEKPKTEEPKAEEPKAEEPKAEAPKAEAPKAEQPQIEGEAAEQKPDAPAAQGSEETQQQVSEAIGTESEQAVEAEQPVEVAEAAEEAETAEQADEGSELDSEQDIAIIEDEPAPLAVRPSTPVDGSVRIFASTDCPKPGDRVKLLSELVGFEGSYNLLFQWQVNKGNGWQDIPGANGPTYEFIFDESVQSFRWRLAVSIDE